MTGFTLPLTCAVCGSECSPVTIGKPIDGRETSAVVRCTRNHEWIIKVVMAPIRQNAADYRCGTDAGYQAHRNSGQPPCDDCRLAHSWVNGGYRKVRSRELAPMGTIASGDA